MFEGKRQDLLASAVFDQLEIVRGQTGDDGAAAIADDYIDEHQVDAAPETRLLTGEDSARHHSEHHKGDGKAAAHVRSGTWPSASSCASAGLKALVRMSEN